MSIYPDAPGHRNVETSIAAADDLAPKLGRLQRMAETQFVRLARAALLPMNWPRGWKWTAIRSSRAPAN